MFYFQFRLTMRFPWRIHFEGSKMSILLRLPTSILTGFFLMVQHLFPGTRGCERGQGPGYFLWGAWSHFPHPALGCLPWSSELLGKLFQSLKGFLGRANISLWQRSSSSLCWGIMPLDCLRGWRKRPANRSPGVTAVWGNLWPILPEPTGNTIYGEKKSILPRTLVKTSERR